MRKEKKIVTITCDICGNPMSLKHFEKERFIVQSIHVIDKHIGDVTSDDICKECSNKIISVIDDIKQDKKG